jgi:hypothetical protein
MKKRFIAVRKIAKPPIAKLFHTIQLKEKNVKYKNRSVKAERLNNHHLYI